MLSDPTPKDTVTGELQFKPKEPTLVYRGTLTVKWASCVHPAGHTFTRDVSFSGIGLPSLRGKPGFSPEKSAARGGKPVWYSHSAEDTLDKLDMEVIKPTFKVNTVSLVRLCNCPILPYDFAAVAKALQERLNELQEESISSIDLTSAITSVKILKEKAENLNKIIERNLLSYKEMGSDGDFEKGLQEINRCLIELSRILMPVFTTKAGPYGYDAWGTMFKPIPVLQPLEAMNSMDRNSEAYKALCTSLVRERNKVSDALNLANRVLDNMLK